MFRGPAMVSGRPGWYKFLFIRPHGNEIVEA
jgi:hypothetical protein